MSGFLFEDNYATQSLSLEDFCHLARQCGYAGVELRQTQIGLSTSSSERENVQQLLKSCDLHLTCLTMRNPPPGWAERDAYLQRYLDLCLELDCSLLKVTGSADWLSHAACLARSSGVRLATNNHVGTVTETIPSTDALLRSIPQDNFGLLFDPMHLFVARENPAAPIAQWVPRIFNVLFQCVREARTQDEVVFRHRGISWTKCRPTEREAPPWESIAARLVCSGYDGWITVVENAWPCDERRQIAAESAEYLENVFLRAASESGSTDSGEAGMVVLD